VDEPGQAKVYLNLAILPQKWAFGEVANFEG
jgi:hypothetical protein